MTTQGQIRWYVQADGTYVAFGENFAPGGARTRVESKPRGTWQDALEEVLVLLGLVS